MFVWVQWKMRYTHGSFARPTFLLAYLVQYCPAHLPDIWTSRSAPACVVAILVIHVVHDGWGNFFDRRLNLATFAIIYRVRRPFVVLVTFTVTLLLSEQRWCQSRTKRSLLDQMHSLYCICNWLTFRQVFEAASGIISPGCATPNTAVDRSLLYSFLHCLMNV